MADRPVVQRFFAQSQPGTSLKFEPLSKRKTVTPTQKLTTGKAVRYRFSEGDVLFLLVLTEFPFSLSKEDKNSLAKVLAHGNRAADHWFTEGADLVFQSGDMRLLVECKIFRDTVKRNVATYRWGKDRTVSSPDILAGEPVFRNTRIPLEHVAAPFRKNVSGRNNRRRFSRSGRERLGLRATCGAIRNTARTTKKAVASRKRALGFRRLSSIIDQSQSFLPAAPKVLAYAQAAGKSPNRRSSSQYRDGRHKRCSLTSYYCAKPPQSVGLNLEE